MTRINEIINTLEKANTPNQCSKMDKSTETCRIGATFIADGKEHKVIRGNSCPFADTDSEASEKCKGY